MSANKCKEDKEALVSLTVEFLEAIIHQILYLRRVYPEEIFEPRRLYSLAVHRSRYPALNEYIESAIAGLRDAIASNKLARFAVLLKDKDKNVLERFVMEPQLLFPTQAEMTTPLTAEIYLDIESHLRAAVLKLQFNASTLNNLIISNDLTFELVAYSKDRTALPLNEWAAEQPDHGNIELKSDEGSILPIKSFTIEGCMKLQMYVEIKTHL